MSLINQMLRDLDARRAPNASSGISSEVRVQAAPVAPRSPLVRRAGLGAALLGAAGYAWFSAQQADSPAPVVAVAPPATLPGAGVVPPASLPPIPPEQLPGQPKDVLPESTAPAVSPAATAAGAAVQGATVPGTTAAGTAPSVMAVPATPPAFAASPAAQAVGADAAAVQPATRAIPPAAGGVAPGIPAWTGAKPPAPAPAAGPAAPASPPVPAGGRAQAAPASTPTAASTPVPATAPPRTLQAATAVAPTIPAGSLAKPPAAVAPPAGPKAAAAPSVTAASTAAATPAAATPGGASVAVTAPSAPRAAAPAPTLAAAAPQRPPAAQSIEKTAPTVPLRERAEAEYRKAVNLLNQGRPPEAVDGLKAALRLDGTHVAARQLLLRLFVEGKRNDEAAELLQEGLDLLPAQSAWAMSLARLQVDRGDLPAAARTLQRSLPAGAGSAAYQGFVGHVQQRLGHFGDAVEHYRAAAQLAPGDGRWWLGLGLALEAENRAAEAREAFQRAKAAGGLGADLAGLVEQKLRTLP